MKKPWWQTWWFELLGAAVFIVCFLCLVFFLLWAAVNTPGSTGVGATELKVPKSRMEQWRDRDRKYGDHFYEMRWRRMCNGPERYDAMREAHELGRPNPCG